MGIFMIMCNISSVWKLFKLYFLSFSSHTTYGSSCWWSVWIPWYIVLLNNFKQIWSSKGMISFLHMTYSSKKIMIDLEFASCTKKPSRHLTSTYNFLSDDRLKNDWTSNSWVFCFFLIYSDSYRMRSLCRSLVIRNK